MSIVTLNISGMNCASCVRRIEDVLAKSPGIGSAEVNLASETARVGIENPSDLEPAVQALEKAGYKVALEERSLALTGLTCAGCVRRSEQALLGTEGVLSAEVNLASQQARIRMLPGTDPAAVLAALDKAGYPGAWLGDERRDDSAIRSQQLKAERYRLIIAALLSAPLALGMLPALVGRHDLMVPPMIQLVLASIVQFGFGARFYIGAWHALRNRTGNMDMLVAMGTSAGWALSTWHIFTTPAGQMPVLYYEPRRSSSPSCCLGSTLKPGPKGRRWRPYGRSLPCALIPRD